MFSAISVYKFTQVDFIILGHAQFKQRIKHKNLKLYILYLWQGFKNAA